MGVGSFIFDVPARFGTEFLSGNVVRYGAILKDSSTGRIVGHLQETGAAQNLFRSVGDLISNPTPLQLLSNYQIFRVDRKISVLQSLVEGVRTLQYANIALGTIGIGVSVAGFALTNARLKQIDKRIDNIEDSLSAINSKIDSIQQGLIDAKDQQLVSALKSLDTYGMIDDVSRRHNAIDLAGNSVRPHLEFYQKEIDRAIRQGRHVDIISALVSRYALSASLVVQCWLLTDQNSAALHDARQIAQDANNLFDSFGPIEFAALEGADTKSELQALAATREVQDLINSRPIIVSEILESEVRGSDYCNSISNFGSEPLVLVRRSH